MAVLTNGTTFKGISSAKTIRTAAIKHSTYATEYMDEMSRMFNIHDSSKNDREYQLALVTLKNTGCIK